MANCEWSLLSILLPAYSDDILAEDMAIYQKAAFIDSGNYFRAMFLPVECHRK